MSGEGVPGVPRLIGQSRDFFAPLGGQVGVVRTGQRRNVEVLDDRRVPRVSVCSLEVTFEDVGIFGDGGFREAYDRYRRLRSDWWDHLAMAGTPLWTTRTPVIPHLHPLPGEGGGRGNAYPRQRQPALGCDLTPIDEIRAKNSYYGGLFEGFGVEWVLQDPHGIVIGPDAGLLHALATVARERGRIADFVDVGAGTGELSGWLLRNDRGQRLHVVEASHALGDHLRSFLLPLAEKGGARVDLQMKDALEMELPEKIDVVSLGIYYGAQPPFLRRYGEELSRRMAVDGVVMVQSGMLEGTFNLACVTGEDRRLFGWPWYDESRSLSTYFPHLKTVFIADELVTLASHSAKTLERLVQRLAAGGDLSVPPLEIHHDLAAP